MRLYVRLLGACSRTSVTMLNSSRNPICFAPDALQNVDEDATSVTMHDLILIKHETHRGHTPDSAFRTQRNTCARLLCYISDKVTSETSHGDGIARGIPNIYSRRGLQSENDLPPRRTTRLDSTAHDLHYYNNKVASSLNEKGGVIVKLCDTGLRRYPRRRLKPE